MSPSSIPKTTNPKTRTTFSRLQMKRWKISRRCLSRFQLKKSQRSNCFCRSLTKKWSKWIWLTSHQRTNSKKIWKRSKTQTSYLRRRWSRSQSMTSTSSPRCLNSTWLKARLKTPKFYWITMSPRGKRATKLMHWIWSNLRLKLIRVWKTLNWNFRSSDHSFHSQKTQVWLKGKCLFLTMPKLSAGKHSGWGALPLLNSNAPKQYKITFNTSKIFTRDSSCNQILYSPTTPNKFNDIFRRGRIKTLIE